VHSDETGVAPPVSMGLSAAVPVSASEPPAASPVRGTNRGPSKYGSAGGDDVLDASLLLLVPVILTNVWYWQLIITPLAPLRPGILSVLAAIVAFFASRRPHDVFRNPAKLPIRLVLVIGAIAVLGGPFALLRGRALEFVYSYFLPSISLAFLIAARVRSTLSLRVVLDAMVLGGIPYAIVYLQAPVDGYGKPLGLPYYDANDGAMIAVCCMALALARFAISRGVLARMAMLALVPLYLAVVIRSTSRGGFLTLVGTALFVMLMARSVKARWRIGVIAAATAFVLALAPPSYWEFMRTLMKPEDDYNWAGNADGGRVELWKRGVGYMIEKPLLGSGALSYPAREGTSPLARKRAAEGRGFGWLVAHNAFVEIGVELGIPALVCFVMVLFKSIAALRRAARNARAPAPLRQIADFLTASILAYCMGSIFLSSQYWSFLYVLVALAGATATIAAGPRRKRRARAAAVARSETESVPELRPSSTPVLGGLS
jgi:O-antigen ligase